eukprot:2180173-Amphidinium_carterae.1
MMRTATHERMGARNHKLTQCMVLPACIEKWTHLEGNCTRWILVWEDEFDWQPGLSGLSASLATCVKVFCLLTFDKEGVPLLAVYRCLIAYLSAQLSCDVG